MVFVVWTFKGLGTESQFYIALFFIEIIGGNFGEMACMREFLSRSPHCQKGSLL